jgi:hypothetical protein
MAKKLILSKIEHLPLRRCWQNEASDFTPWLAEEENMARLAEAIGMTELEVIATEEKVGSFRADILCNDPINDRLVLIENQLEKTDHNHLGQILTYAAGLDAATIIWIAEKFTEEHRAAIDWLNRITDKNFNFFGVEIQLIKIRSNKSVAPVFNVIAKPNDWSKDVRSSSQKKADTAAEKRQAKFEFWCDFCEYMRNNPSKLFKPESPTQQYWMSFDIGSSRFNITLLFHANIGRATVRLYMPEDQDKTCFDALVKNREKAEKTIGSELEWNRYEGQMISTIDVYLHNCNFTDRTGQQVVFAWYKDYTERFIKYFKPIIKKL